MKGSIFSNNHNQLRNPASFYTTASQKVSFAAASFHLKAVIWKWNRQKTFYPIWRSCIWAPNKSWLSSALKDPKAFADYAHIQISGQGRELWSNGYWRRLRFESQHRILDGHISHWFVVQIVMFAWKRPKRDRCWPIFYRSVDNLINAWNWRQSHIELEIDLEHNELKSYVEC